MEVDLPGQVGTYEFQILIRQDKSTVSEAVVYLQKIVVPFWMTFSP